MIWWIALAIAGFGLVLLVLVMLPVLRRLAILRRAAERAQRGAADTQQLQASVEALQGRLAELSGHLETVADQLANNRITNRTAGHGR
jgi:heme exporter protein D